MSPTATCERRDVGFTSQGLRCTAWQYLPAGLAPGERRPAIVMAHGYSGVKEQYLENFARPFAEAGFVVLVFDYRFLGASEGEPRQQILWHEQINDYRNAITWISMQPGVDASRIGVWGTSYSGGHVMHVAAFDRRVKAVVAQVPAVSTWESYFAALPAEQVAQLSAWHAQARAERMRTGEVLYAPVVAPPGQSAVMPQPEAHEWVTRAAGLAPELGEPRHGRVARNGHVLRSDRVHPPDCADATADDHRKRRHRDAHRRAAEGVRAGARAEVAARRAGTTLRSLRRPAASRVPRARARLVRSPPGRKLTPCRR
jgi:dienelactone hydrolase